MYVGLILSIRTITACPALLVNLTLTVVPKTDHKLMTICPLVHIRRSNVYHNCTFWLYNLCSTNAVTSHHFCLIVATGLQHVT